MTFYQALLNEVDEMRERLSARYARHLVCRPGCSSCCRHNLTVFEAEAEAIRAALHELPPDARERISLQASEVRGREQRGEPVSCPILVDDRCAIYHSRPVICRTQGLPLLYVAEDGQQEVDFCPLNFTAPNAVDDLEEAHLVPLDALNQKLVKVNIEHCSHNALTPSAGARSSMSTIILSR
jgi:Fe-S-cluster containining protein